MSEKTLENSYVLRGKITSMQAPDKSLTKEGVPADAKAVGEAIQEAATGSPTGGANAVFGHIESQSNPHNVTKAQVGLGNVDNTSDMDKPVSTAQQAAINAIGNGVVGTVNEHTETLKTVLHKTGGTMTGALTLIAPTNDLHAATKKYVDDATNQILTALTAVAVTLTVAGWSGDEAPYAQTVNVTGMPADWKAGYYTILSNVDIADDLALQEVANCLTKVVTADGSMTFTCGEDKPEVDMNLLIHGALEVAADG